MKKLILILALALVSVGAWAQHIATSNAHSITVADEGNLEDVRVNRAGNQESFARNFHDAITLQIYVHEDNVGTIQFNGLGADFTGVAAIGPGRTVFITVRSKLWFIGTDDNDKFEIFW